MMPTRSRCLICGCTVELGALCAAHDGLAVLWSRVQAGKASDWPYEINHRLMATVQMTLDVSHSWQVELQLLLQELGVEWE